MITPSCQTLTRGLSFYICLCSLLFILFGAQSSLALEGGLYLIPQVILFWALILV